MGKHAIATLAATCALALFATAAPAQESKIVIDGSTTVGPIVKAFAEYYQTQYPEVNITISESGSGNGAKSLINSTCNIASMSRFMTDTEFKASVEQGVYPVAHVVAFDGLAVVTHPANPIRDLTVEQVRDIYTGKITNWNEVGGPNRPIVVVSRDTNSGTYEAFAALVLQGENVAGEAEKTGSNGQILARVQSTPTAIGYLGLGFVDRSVKAVNINGVEATPGTVRSGAYPIGRPLYLFTNGYPQLGTQLFQFCTLHQSKIGQEMIESIGFVPVTEY